MLNRRSFLRLFGAGAAAMVLDPELLLWKPGEKTIFLPAVQAFEGNYQLLTIDIITRDALNVLRNNLKFVGSFERPYGDTFNVVGFPSGRLIKRD